MSDNLVKLSQVSFKRDQRLILDGVDITIRRGKVTAIMGPSGCGKTTLLSLIGGQLRAHQGRVEVDGKNMATLTRHELYRVRRDMGMLFQSGALFTNLSVFENVAFPLREHTNLPDEIIRDVVLMKLQAVGLRGAVDLMPSALSGGMARRVALARAIALDPALVMYDEPFAGLDPIAMGVIVKLIRELCDALNLTTVLVSHDVPETMRIADYIYLIADGKIVGEGTPDELKINKSPKIEQFIHGIPDGVVPFHYPASKYEEDLLQ